MRPIAFSRNTGRAATSPAEKTKDPTPRSMREVPHVSTLAKRLGNSRKSTARIATQVAIIMQPRKFVRNGFVDRISNCPELSLDRALGGTLAFFFRLIGRGGRVKMRMAGAIRRRLSRRGELEYRVIESRIAPTLRRKSTANASTVYGSKKDWRAWSTDQSRIATCNKSFLATLHGRLVRTGGLGGQTAATDVT